MRVGMCQVCKVTTRRRRLLMAGVFIGSALWWLALFAGLTLFRLNISNGFLAVIHRASGVVIVGLGIVVRVSQSPLKQTLNITF